MKLCLDPGSRRSSLTIDSLGSLQDGRKPLHMSLAKVTDLEHYEDALLYGAKKVIEGKVALAEALLEAKADVNWTDKVRRIAIGAYRCRCCILCECGFHRCCCCSYIL